MKINIQPSNAPVEPMLYFQAGFPFNDNMMDQKQGVKKQQSSLSCRFYQDYATFHFTLVKNLCYFYTDQMRREQQRMKDENKRQERISLGAQQGSQKGQKWLKLPKSCISPILLPSNSLWQKIFIVFTLILSRGSSRN